MFSKRGKSLWGQGNEKFVEDNKNKFALLNPSEYDEGFNVAGILYVKVRGVEGLKSKLVLKVGQIAKESPISSSGEFCYELTGQEVATLKEKGVMLGDYAYLFSARDDLDKKIVISDFMMIIKDLFLNWIQTSYAK